MSFSQSLKRMWDIGADPYTALSQLILYILVITMFMRMVRHHHTAKLSEAFLYASPSPCLEIYKMQSLLGKDIFVFPSVLM